MRHKGSGRKAGPFRLPGRRGRQLLAWCVHFYTALGLVAAAGMAWALLTDPPWFRLAFLLMFVATVIDATDGTFARLVRVKEFLPGFDGRRLDDLIDFQTYTVLPLLLIWRAGLLAPEHSWCLLLPLLASAYGFCQTAAKTDDGFFLGFPSYWNLVAFYLYLAHPAEWVSLTVLIGLSVLTFVPSRYLYPTVQRSRLNQLSNQLGVLWAALLVWILWRMPENGTATPAEDPLTRSLIIGSLYYPVFYLTASWAISVRHWRRRRRVIGPAVPTMIEEIQAG
jgi:phosphatidylcholine synthase